MRGRWLEAEGTVSQVVLVRKLLESGQVYSKAMATPAHFSEACFREFPNRLCPCWKGEFFSTANRIGGGTDPDFGASGNWLTGQLPHSL